MATGDNLTSAKAVAGAVAGLLAPGAAYLIAQSGDGLTSTEWLIAGLTAIVTAGAVGGTVYAVENRPKASPPPPPPLQFG